MKAHEITIARGNGDTLYQRVLHRGDNAMSFGVGIYGDDVIALVLDHVALPVIIPDEGSIAITVQALPEPEPEPMTPYEWALVGAQGE